MIDFDTLKGLIIPEGVVVRIEREGEVLWEKVEENLVVSLEVEKITSDTYANNTTYAGEEFILLNIYPKTNGTVSITYGDLTKTITDTSGDAEPAAQKVYFGTFNGMSDEVETPESGELTISGDYRAFGSGGFNTAKSKTAQWNCITKVNNCGRIEAIPVNAFQDCLSLQNIVIPDSVITIDFQAFRGCSTLTSVTIGKGVNSIAGLAFSMCTSLTSVHITDLAAWCGIDFYSNDSNPLYTARKLYLNDELITNLVIPDGVTAIGNYAFCNGDCFESVTIPESVTSIGDHAFYRCSKVPEIIIPDSVISIGNYAFYHFYRLLSITIPDSVINIGAYAFCKCLLLEKAIIGENVTSIGSHAFDETEHLTSVTFKNTDGWYYVNDNGEHISIDVTNPETNVSNFKGAWLEVDICRS